MSSELTRRPIMMHTYVTPLPRSHELKPQAPYVPSPETQTAVRLVGGGDKSPTSPGSFLCFLIPHPPHPLRLLRLLLLTILSLTTPSRTTIGGNNVVHQNRFRQDTEPLHRHQYLFLPPPSPSPSFPPSLILPYRS